MLTMYYLWMMLQMLDKYSKNVITPNEKCVLMMNRISIEESEENPMKLWKASNADD